MKYTKTTATVIVFIVLLSGSLFAQKLNTPNVDSILFVGDGKKQPLVVGLGGSEGGNAWASDYWKKTRDQFIKRGYAFLAIGYFGAEGTPKNLDRISIEEVYRAIQTATKNPKVRKNRIAIVGGSRGADLALLLASYYDEIDCVVGLVASHAVFPAHTEKLSTSSWTFGGTELPFVPVSEEAIPAMIARDIRSAFEIMLKNKEAEAKSLIRVERINGPVLLISATRDEIAPTTPMANKIIERLQNANFKYCYRHYAIEGKHVEATKHFDKVFTFLEQYFYSGKKKSCRR